MPYKDKEKQLESQRKHYIENKEIYNNRRRVARSYKKDYVVSFKTEKGCLVCGYNKHYSCLDLHHINEDEKEKDPSRVHYCSFKTIDEELSKCIVLCRNCHAEHHAGLIDASVYAVPITDYNTYNEWDKKKRFTKDTVLLEHNPR